jgi:CDP-glucose 4,6-dehydratase
MSLSETRQGWARIVEKVYRDKRVLVTGHTGFKGSWLCEWLLQLGCRVSGLALPTATDPALFEQLGLAGRIQQEIGDVRDLALVSRVVRDSEPDFIFHLAAQPLVRLSYEQPVETYGTNVMGTVNVLEAVRVVNRPCSVVIVTTDKCYENREWVHSYREEDSMGGHDPYSSSKGAAELVAASYRRSFFSVTNSHVRVATARAGNVIGGGDWARDRIVPDCIRALQRREVIQVRNKTATRPWQHVMEPLSGYLLLGSSLAEPDAFHFPAKTYAASFNFGPELDSNRTVAELVQEIVKHWSGRWEDRSTPDAVHEAKLLNLAIDKAHHLLGWRPKWDFEIAVRNTVDWYREVFQGNASASEMTRAQIAAYIKSSTTTCGLRAT